MVWIDYIIIIVISLSSLISLIRGFVREILSLITWSSAFFVASQFYPYLTSYVISVDDMLVKNIIAIVILFVIVLIIGSIVNYVINLLIKKTGLNGPNYLLGACFGVLRGIFIVSAIIFFLDTFTSLPKSENWQYSELIPQFIHIIKWFFDKKDILTLLAKCFCNVCNVMNKSKYTILLIKYFLYIKI